MPSRFVQPRYETWSNSSLLFWLFLLGILGLAGCDQHDNEASPATAPLSFETPDHYLSYPNHQYSLSAGTYEIVVTPTANADAHSYRVIATQTNGQQSTYSGTWNGSETPTQLSDYPHHSLVVEQPGGVDISVDAPLEVKLYLLKNKMPVATASGKSLSLPASQISSQAYAEAYYRAIDPDIERTTLADWKRKNGFYEGEDAHVVFRDTKDLGYGRNMHMRKLARGGYAIFVENYVVKELPVENTVYSVMNLDAAIQTSPEHHIGTNAIEFSPLDANDPASPFITRMFTFSAAEDDSRAVRLTQANLDGRGMKYLPQNCLVCHGGTLLPLDKDGKFPTLSLYSIKPNLLDTDSFEFSTLPGYTLTDMEPGIKMINQAVQAIYQTLGAMDPVTPAKWSETFALAVAAGSYPANVDTYNADFIPDGWKQTGTRPEGVEKLYTTVIKPHCFGCHSLRGTQAGESVKEPGSDFSHANAINFNSYEQFISFNDLIIDYVYQRGWMPLSLRNYESFWRHPQGAPALLASFLDGFSQFDSDGKVLLPGLPLAKPGADRTVTSPVSLDARASLFAKAYQWRVISAPQGSTYTLSSKTTVAPVFSADTDGAYQLGLTVTNARGSSAEALLTLTLDSSIKPPAALTFVEDIRPILGSATQTLCSNCHQKDTLYPGIPVRWDDGNSTLYQDIRARVDFNDPENSLLLRKPTRKNHGGGIQIDPTSISGKSRYNTLLNWIREGAVCGNDPAFCPH